MSDEGAEESSRVSLENSKQSEWFGRDPRTPASGICYWIHNAYIHKLLKITDGFERSYKLMTACMLSHFSRVWLCVTLWTVICKAPLFMWSSRQEYWSGLPCSSPGDPPDPGIASTSLTFPALAGGFFTTSPLGKPLNLMSMQYQNKARSKQSKGSFSEFTLTVC